MSVGMRTTPPRQPTYVHDVLDTPLELDAGTAEAGFHDTKLATGRYYMKRQLPMTATHLARIETGADPVMALTADQF